MGPIIDDFLKHENIFEEAQRSGLQVWSVNGS